MINFKRLLEKDSQRAFLFSTLYAFGAALIYFVTDFKNPLLFLPACGYAFKGLYRRNRELKTVKN